MIRRLLELVRRFFGRRAARRLLATNPPRGLLPAPFRLALRPGFSEPSPSEMRALPLGAAVVRGRRPFVLFRLSALPPPLPDLGVARPARFGLDEELRVAIERDPLRVPSDAPPPVPIRRIRPRVPLARAPLARFRGRNFRLDAGGIANEQILPLDRPDFSWRWLSGAFRRQYVELPWMAKDRIAFLGPLQAEWFVMWWDQEERRKPGGRENVFYELPEELGWQLAEVKEQMLIRRDVKKDEQAPPLQDFVTDRIGEAIASREPQTDLSGLIPKKEWLPPIERVPPPASENASREAYLQWRTLMDALEER